MSALQDHSGEAAQGMVSFGSFALPINFDSFMRPVDLKSLAAELTACGCALVTAVRRGARPDDHSLPEWDYEQALSGIEAVLSLAVSAQQHADELETAARDGQGGGQ